MKDLVIIGAGGFGREMFTHIGWINDQEPTWNFLGYIDDNATETVEGHKILGGLDYLFQMDPKPYYFIAIADSKVREQIANRCKAAGLTAATIIGNVGTIAPNAEIGEGCYIGHHTSLMTNVKIGPFCIIQDRCSFGHDTEVGAFTSTMSNCMFGGESKIGAHNYFGLRATIINRVNTVDYCTFGACACVVKDAAEPGTWVGVPAKLVKPLKK